jgi:hypothetical protein
VPAVLAFALTAAPSLFVVLHDGRDARRQAGSEIVDGSQYTPPERVGDSRRSVEVGKGTKLPKDAPGRARVSSIEARSHGAALAGKDVGDVRRQPRRGRSFLPIA